MSSTSQKQLANPFCWYELLTSDTPAAQAFYKKVLGWTASLSEGTDRDYHLLHVGKAAVAGMMPIPKEACDAGMPPNWSGYIAVTSVDEHVKRFVAEGGKVWREAEDIPGVGRFAVVSDPQGAGLVLFSPLVPQEGEGVPNTALGQVGWHELMTDDAEKAIVFYTKMFGWSVVDSVDMGAMGKYHLLSTGGPEPLVGMMTKMPEMPFSYWGFYFNVASIGAAKNLVEQNGGKVVMGPQEVPGGSWVLNCTDPQGAFFSLVSSQV